ncbi:hypothetical protein KKH59_02850 [Patescibacteria group bacterium]|nr:hypothetical protein [Patescibacteria group bacterium]
MQIFELYFNPRPRRGFGKQAKLERDTAFDSFCYEPENIYEKKLGGIYMAGEIKNVLPQNLRLLDKISQVIKERYYGYNLKSPEEALKESLKALNGFFSQEVKKDNVSWLGNLSLAIVSLTKNREFFADLNFTKIGGIKTLLLRDGQISDIGSKLDLQEIEPYPLKVFSNIVSGKLADGDIIAILTKDISEIFREKNLIQKIAAEKQLKEKKIKEILKPEERDLVKISGICLLISIQPETQKKSILDFQEKLENFSLSQLIKNSYRFLNSGLSCILSKVKIPQFTPLERFGSFWVVRFKVCWRFLTGLKLPVLNKNLILIFLLIFVLLSGFFLYQKENKKEALRIENQLNGIKEKIARAENLLELKDDEKANLLFKETFEDILPLTKENSPSGKKALILKKSIEESLNKLNKLEKIEAPEIIFTFDPQETKLIPYQVLLATSTLYFYNPLSSNVYKLGLQGIGELLEGKINLHYGIQYLDSLLFFSKPNSLISLKDNQFQEKNFEMPDFNALASFHSSIYFLDSRAGEIIKQSPTSNKKILWLKPETKKAVAAKSIAVDGSVWVLTQNNQIDRYHGGEFQETIKINIFPELKSPIKILTSALFPYFYLLEPEQKRLIILTKEGKIVKQEQSEKFNNLLDFSVSADGKIIWLLNGLKVYKISE